MKKGNIGEYAKSVSHAGFANSIDETNGSRGSDIQNIVNETKILSREDRYNNDSTVDLQKISQIKLKK